MKIKTSDRLLSLLCERQGEYVSGADCAEALGVSRTAVWKAVNALRDGGWEISAVTNKGYRLESGADVLSLAGVMKHAHEGGFFDRLTVLNVATSTNTLLKGLAAEGAAEGTVIIAGEQTAGRGRLGRSFFSPSGTGVYISVLLRPQISAEKATMITTTAAVCVCEAIEKAIPGKSPAIKWVNDVFLSGKKVCGILTEAGFDAENGNLDYAVCGVGINVYEPDGGFPEELADIAGSVLEERQADIRNRIAAGFLNSFYRYYKNQETCVDEYRRRSFVVGKKIRVISPKGEKSAVAKGIGDDCSLTVEYPDGTTEALRSGEISIRAESD